MHVKQPACRYPQPPVDGSLPSTTGNRFDVTMLNSTALADHLEARKLCAVCPRLRQCLNAAIAMANDYDSALPACRQPSGTYAGLLWVNGHIRDGMVA